MTIEINLYFKSAVRSIKIVENAQVTRLRFSKLQFTPLFSAETFGSVTSKKGWSFGEIDVI